MSGGFGAFLRAVLDLRAETGVPHTLAGLGVDAAQRELIAEMAIADPTAGSNPVPLTKEGALRIFDAAMAGDPT
jgi:alcohol dehydrogenase